MYKTKATSEEKITTAEAYPAGEESQAEWAKKFIEQREQSPERIAGAKESCCG
ncbi:MAG: hypothetical protein LLG09_06505 [Negativicutes bacterium]|nr:hypothetical protein [Negativicutes bacterium]